MLTNYMTREMHERLWVCLAKSQPELRCHPCNMLQTALYVSDFNCVLDFGEGQARESRLRQRKTCDQPLPLPLSYSGISCKRDWQALQTP